MLTLLHQVVTFYNSSMARRDEVMLSTLFELQTPATYADWD